MKCTHTPHEHNVAVAKGCCVLCLQQENQALREHLRMANNEISVANDKIAHCVHIRDANLKMHNDITRLREALKKIEAMYDGINLGPYANHPGKIAEQALAPQEGKQE